MLAIMIMFYVYHLHLLCLHLPSLLNFMAVPFIPSIPTILDIRLVASPPTISGSLLVPSPTPASTDIPSMMASSPAILSTRLVTSDEAQHDKLDLLINSLVKKFPSSNNWCQFFHKASDARGKCI